MSPKRFLGLCVLILFGTEVFHPPAIVKAEDIQPAPVEQVSAYELILAMNTLRVAYGLPALIEDPIVDAVAQSTAATMAANNMSWHIGDVRGRIAAAGYGGGATVWATENFAVSSGMGIDEIMAVWSDADHMRPAVTAAYCNIGAGTAQTSDGRTYYVLQAAYVAGKECGSSSSSTSPAGTSLPGATPNAAAAVPQLIMPVKIATPDAEGKVFHVVQMGQSFWSIAISYQITIHDLEVWNNISRDAPLQAGQRLFIPGKNTEGFATPTPVGMIAIQTPDADGRIVHEVGAYQALITIAEAYHVPMEKILALNGLQADGTLQIGQKLIISSGNITPSPTLSAIQKLTPGADGNYYHIVQSGETLSWIAGQYGVSLGNLMAWNGLDATSVIRPEQKLRLLVTPPATPTAARTQTPSPMPPSWPSPAVTPQSTGTLLGAEMPPKTPTGINLSLILGLLMVLIGGGLLWWKFPRKN